MINIRKQNTIPEKSKNIEIKNLFLTNNIKKNKILSKEYSEREDFFDPSNHSPPNEFMQKLQNRITNYCSLEIK
jgi:hypothetical protein